MWFIWNPSICECECDTSYDVEEYLDYQNSTYTKKLVDKIVEQCSEDIKGNEVNIMHDLSLLVYFRFKLYVWTRTIRSKCYDIWMVYELESIAILNVKGIDYRSVLWNMTWDDEIDMLNNSKLDDKSSLWIWTLAQTKQLLK